MKNKQLWLMMIFAVLYGCASIMEEVTVDKKYSVFLNNTFIAKGKAALRYPQCDPYRGCKQQAYSANIDWSHLSDGDEIRLFNPTGQAVVSIRYQGRMVSVEDKKGQREISREALAEELGIEIPIEKFQQWFFTPTETEKFTDDGWKVQVEKWQGGYYRRVTLVNQDYYLRIFINKISVL